MSKKLILTKKNQKQGNKVIYDQKLFVSCLFISLFYIQQHMLEKVRLASFIKSPWSHNSIESFKVQAIKLNCNLVSRVIE